MNFDIALDFLKRLKRIYFSILILITLIAIGFLLYPSFSNYINNKFAVSTISDYTEKINNVKDEEVDDLIKNINNVSIEDYWITGDVRPGREEEQWLNLMLRKTNS